MQGLDDIPWHSLHHAYGTAEDVPDLIRQLQIADPDASNEDSTLWYLFGNIWHQGTVYEATSYAVPFFIKLVEDPGTPDRVGILGLLAAIAQGASYLTLEPGKLSREQQRALKAVIAALDVQDQSLQLSFVSYGLPDSRRQLRKLAAGQPIDLTVDETLPVIGDPSVPAKPLALWRLKSGDRIHSRYFGLGTVRNVTPRQYDIELVVDFDEEGRTTLGLIDSPPRYVVDAARYFLRRLFRRE